MIAELVSKLFDSSNRYNRVEFGWYQLLSALLFVGLVSTVSLTYHWMKLIVPDNLLWLWFLRWFFLLDLLHISIAMSVL